MTRHETALTIDLGERGSARHKALFKVQLDAPDLVQLFEHAANAHRIYELMLLTRPGDIWPYITVHIISLPGEAAERAKNAREWAHTNKEMPHPWPENTMPFPEFNALFSYYHESGEDDAWLNYKNHHVIEEYAKFLLVLVKVRQCADGWDALIGYVKQQIKAGTHPFDMLSRKTAIKESRDWPRNSYSYNDDFYFQLKKLLRDKHIRSVAYIGYGDYRLLRILATEQRCRTKASDQDPLEALEINARTNREKEKLEWCAEIRFFAEGVGYGDLFIHDAERGEHIRRMIENKHHNIPDRYILCRADQGELPGFEREVGEGWVLYARQGLEGNPEWSKH